MQELIGNSIKRVVRIFASLSASVNQCRAVVGRNLSVEVKVIVLSAALLCAALPALCESAATFRGDIAHTGVYDAQGVPSFNQVKWTFHTKGQIVSSPAVVGEVVYAGSTDGNFYALDRESGTQKWKFEAKSRIASSPAVAGGLVYFGAYTGTFYALDAASGQVKWKFQTGGEHRFTAKHLDGLQPADEAMPDPWDCFLSSPAVWNGAVYFGSGDGNVYALDAATGALRWKFQTGDVVHSSPAIAHGTLFIGSWDSYFYALDAGTGKQKWRFKTGEDPVYHNQVGIQSSPAVIDGMVYFGCRDANLYALDEMTGEKKWAYSTHGAWVITSPAVSQGKLYFATSDSGQFFALDAKTGNVVYSLSFLGWPAFSSPAIAGDMLYVGTFGGKLNVVDLKAHKIAWSFATEASKQNAPAITKPDGTADFYAPFVSDFYDDMLIGYGKLLTLGPILSSPVVVDKVVYFGAMDGNLYALK
jgi:outer membrane protein assembly factor BamB